jgi:DNA polymerase III alpha subunit
MHTDIYGQIIFNEDDLCEVYLTDPNKKFKEILTDVEISLPKILDITYPNIKLYNNPNLSIEDFDKINQDNWHIPVEYKNFDIAKFVLEQCKNDAELQRAGQELLLFQELGMFDLLKFLKYLVDTMRQNNIVWGVGRGSSVSSFVLYLIGIHKINSQYYDLSIDEFLK